MRIEGNEVAVNGNHTERLRCVLIDELFFDAGCTRDIDRLGGGLVKIVGFEKGKAIASFNILIAAKSGG